MIETFDLTGGKACISRESTTPMVLSMIEGLFCGTIDGKREREFTFLLLNVAIFRDRVFRLCDAFRSE